MGVAALVIFCHTTVFPLTSCTMYRRYMTSSYYKYSLNTVKNCLGRSLVLDYECHACWVGVVSRNSDTYVPNIKPVSCQTKKTACWCLVWEEYSLYIAVPSRACGRMQIAASSAVVVPGIILGKKSKRVSCEFDKFRVDTLIFTSCVIHLSLRILYVHRSHWLVC